MNADLVISSMMLANFKFRYVFNIYLVNVNHILGIKVRSQLFRSENVHEGCAFLKIMIGWVKILSELWF
jgi:hypothetical protein